MTHTANWQTTKHTQTHSHENRRRRKVIVALSVYSTQLMRLIHHEVMNYMLLNLATKLSPFAKFMHQL